MLILCLKSFFHLHYADVIDACKNVAAVHEIIIW